MEREQRSLKHSSIPELQAKVAAGTSVARLLSNITSLTNPELVRNLCTLSDEEKRRLEEIDRTLTDLQASDPDKLIRRLNVKIARVKSLSEHIARVQKALSAEAVRAILEIRDEERRKRGEAARIRKTTFSEDMLDGTGSDVWAKFWEAARQFSEEFAYPGKTFPTTEENSRCLLCQRDLDHVTRHRLGSFEAFVKSMVERELQDIRGRYTKGPKTHAHR